MTPTTIQFRASRPYRAVAACSNLSTAQRARLPAQKPPSAGRLTATTPRGYIYVADEVDPRQLALIGADHG